ncbi:hypothetical protein [uncultured Nostoc sp.]|uniref:hypothetical protein n=1 Tax=uncultured Nostoc sp. TaxID=340711 RepID=UPI0035CA0A93
MSPIVATQPTVTVTGTTVMAAKPKGNGNWSFAKDNTTSGNGNWNLGNNNDIFGNANTLAGSNNDILGSGNTGSVSNSNLLVNRIEASGDGKTLVGNEN